MGGLNESGFSSVLGDKSVFERGSKEVVRKGSVDRKSRDFFGEVLLKRGIEKCGRIWGGVKGQRKVPSS